MKEKNKIIWFYVILFVYYVLGTTFVLYQQINGDGYAGLGAYIYYIVGILPLTTLLSILFKFGLKKSLKLILISTLCLFIGTTSTIESITIYRENQQMKHYKEKNKTN